MTDDTLQDIVHTLSPALHAYLQRMVGDAATADDLLQESLLKIANGLSTFAGKSSLKTWAFAIATRVVADHFRRAGNRQTTVAIDEAHEPADANVDISETFVVDEMNACIREVIDQLPADYRAALILHDLEGLTAQETAEACNCSLPAAKIRVHRGRRRLEQALERECTFYREDDVLRCDRAQPGKPK
jgi:RNA polymerase sigma-70 factor (ECF subfamily)